MRYLKKIFTKKEKTLLLYRKISRQEFIDYTDNHDRDDYSKSDISKIKSIYKNYIFGENTSNTVTICRKFFQQAAEIFYVIEKYADDWYIIPVD